MCGHPCAGVVADECGLITFTQVVVLVSSSNSASSGSNLADMNSTSHRKSWRSTTVVELAAVVVVGVVAVAVASRDHSSSSSRGKDE